MSPARLLLVLFVFALVMPACEPSSPVLDVAWRFNRNGLRSHCDDGSSGPSIVALRVESADDSSVDSSESLGELYSCTDFRAQLAVPVGTYNIELAVLCDFLDIWWWEVASVDLGRVWVNDDVDLGGHDIDLGSECR